MQTQSVKILVWSILSNNNILNMNFFINDAGGLKIGILGLLLVVFHSHSSVFPGSFLYLPNSPSFESELDLFFFRQWQDTFLGK